MDQTGKASFFGTYNEGGAMPTIGYTDINAVAQSGKIMAVSLEIEYSATVDDLLDPNGEMIGFNRRRRMITVTGEFVVRADTRANARLAIRPPKDLSIVTLAGFVDASHTSIMFNGDWIYKTGGKAAISNDGEAKLTFAIYQHPSSTLTSANLIAAIN